MRKLLELPDYLSLKEFSKSVDFTDKNVYGNWLAQTFYFVSHSVRLSSLGAACSHIDDHVGVRMAHHTTEEMGHHTIAKRDLEHLGFKVSDFPEMGLTKAFYQSQYYRVLFEKPSHLLGQITMLESFAADEGKALYDIVRDAHGEKASEFVRLHANEDQNHVKKAFETLEKLPDAEKQGVTDNFMQACEMYHHILVAISQTTEKNQTSAA